MTKNLLNNKFHNPYISFSINQVKFKHNINKTLIFKDPEFTYSKGKGNHFITVLYKKTINKKLFVNNVDIEIIKKNYREQLLSDNILR